MGSEWPGQLDRRANLGGKAVIDDEATEVVIGRMSDPTIVIGRESDPTIVIGKPKVDSEGNAELSIRISCSDLAASGTIELETWSGGLKRLPSFFDELEEGWRGWTGAKEWNDDGGTVSMSATHDRVGLVTLHLQLDDMVGLKTWRVTIEVPIEPGALAALSQRVRHLVEHPDVAT
jgi:hypothetical protein